MKKSLIYIILCIGFISCNNINTSKIPITTNIIGLELCKKIDYYSINNIFNVSLNKDFYVHEEIVSDDIVIYHCFPYSEPKDKLSFYHENLLWKYITIETFKQQICSITIYDSYDNNSDALKQYKKMLKTFNKKYCKANYLKNDGTDKAVFWSDGITSITLSFQVINIDNIYRCFCELKYYNKSLENFYYERVD